jgi:N-acetylglucosamine kinase-like BadF-type ATPase
MNSLIADSGATSTKWCLKSESASDSIYTEGLNPYYHTNESISAVINDHLVPELKGMQVDEIFFYGAGCDAPDMNGTIYNSLQAAFPDADIEVKHDLLGSARACFFDEPGIAAILGTGSNSCLYDGQKIVEHIESLSFILGDEASAGYFGKKLINSYFRHELPADLEEKLESNYNMNLHHIVSTVYDGQQPSRFVASYARFLGEHQDHPFAQNMLREGFENFITRIIKTYTNASAHKVSFVGSVAAAYQDLISEMLVNEGLTPGAFYRNPLDRLIAYHTSHKKNR